MTSDSASRDRTGPDWSVQAIAHLLDRFASQDDKSVLHVGSGAGLHLMGAVQRGWRGFGVEADAGLRAEAQQSLGDAVHLVAAISELFAHPFDVVVITNLRDLLRRLRFTEIEATPQTDGVIVTGKGSDFATFMQERYVPGTWSKIAAYEHIPRYRLAKSLATGKSVLDFGCGTGYGAAMLADAAKTVTGLDIDESALGWARETHRKANLAFVRHDDLGDSLPAASFDVVTCFEMIEHVDHETQKRAVAGFARLLKDDGLLLISTPNPEVTKLYGANPYHIREMSEAEFRELLAPFPHVTILRQHVRAGVTFSHGAEAANLAPAPLGVGPDAPVEHPMAFVAICSRQAVPKLTDSVFFDDSSDYVGDFMAREQHLQAARADAYSQGAHVRAAKTQYRIMSAQRNDAVTRMNKEIKARMETEDSLRHYQNEYQAKVDQIDLITRMRDEDQKTWNEQLTSPRFLARQLWQALRARLLGR